MKNCERPLVAAALRIASNWKHPNVHQQENGQTKCAVSLLEKLLGNKKEQTTWMDLKST